MPNEITKVMRYQIDRALDCNWQLLNNVLYNLQYETRHILNKTIQLCWEYSGFASDYKEIHGVSPKKKERQDILGYTDLHGFSYNILKDKYNKLYTGNLSQTIKRATDRWNNDLKYILMGERSIPNFKKDSPVDIVKGAIEIHKNDMEYCMDLKLVGSTYMKELQRKSTSFCVKVMVGDKSQQSILDKILNGEYKISASQILNHNKKWFVNLSYSFEPKALDLDTKNIMGIDIGIVNAAYMAFNNSPNRYKIDGGEIDEFRRRVENRRKQLLKQGKYCGDGRKDHGIATRIKPIEKLSEKIANFRDTTNHKYSKYIIEMAVRNNCGTIQIEDLEGISTDNKFLKNWTYYDFQQKIEYKAKEKGIKLLRISPNYTSQRCSKCGYIHKDNRPDQSTFICQKCGFETLADYNAARNISTKDIEKIIQEEIKKRTS